MLSATVNGLFMCFSSWLWGLHSLHVSGLPQGVRALPSGEFSKNVTLHICVCVSLCCPRAHIPASSVYCLPLRTWLTGRKQKDEQADIWLCLSKTQLWWTGMMFCSVLCFCEIFCTTTTFPIDPLAFPCLRTGQLEMRCWRTGRRGLPRSIRATGNVSLTLMWLKRVMKNTLKTLSALTYLVTASSGYS